MRRLTEYPDQNLGDSIEKACMSLFLPTLTRVSLQEALAKAGLKSDKSAASKLESKKAHKISRRMSGISWTMNSFRENHNSAE